jgi:hypothetical protein
MRTDYPKISSINFTFRNASVINMLYKRTGALVGANFDAAKKVESSIDEFIEKNYENVVTPTRAFCIFEFDKTSVELKLGKNREIHFAENSPFGECTLKFKKATDPTIVIHEDTNGSRREKRCKRAIVYLCLIVVAWGYLQTLIWISQISIELIYIRMPPGIDCN